ncbi:MAG: PLP-dependent cysteine synthase family protein [Bacteroidales bacterium]|nr:PLP-dependent cysteine synthase family protein [Bacteroidales bacterium]
MDTNNRIQGLSSLIGNTPLLAVRFKFKGEERTIYAKAENLNMTGSIKDRMAFHILSEAYKNNTLSPNDHIIEATSGNTGISMAAIGCALGNKVTIFMPDWMSDERKNLIRSFGANIRLVSKEEGGFLGSIQMTEDLAAEDDHCFLPCQFSNYNNSDAHYQTTGPEIFWQLRFRDLVPDAFVAGVGTGGTVMGVGKYLKQRNPKIKIHPLEPANSPTLTTGYKVGKHRIQGISDEFIPSLVKLDELDEIIQVDDGDAIIMAQMLSQKLGIGVGISSGANFLGAILAQNMQDGKNTVVATVFSDSNKKYLSTDLMKQEPVKPGFLSSDIELIDFRAFKRVCNTCCDPHDCLEAQSAELHEEFSLPNCPRRN